MNTNQTNELYVQRFIDSMENDYLNWKMNHCAGPGMAWTEFNSPDYTNDNGRISFGFSLCNDGAWIDGHFRWSLPLSINNPFTKNFWRFRKATRQMKRYLRNIEHQDYLAKLNSVI